MQKQKIMLDHFASGIGSNQSCKWGIEWDLYAAGLSCCLASNELFTLNGHRQRISVSVIARPCNQPKIFGRKPIF